MILGTNAGGVVQALVEAGTSVALERLPHEGALHSRAVRRVAHGSRRGRVAGMVVLLPQSGQWRAGLPSRAGHQIARLVRLRHDMGFP